MNTTSGRCAVAACGFALAVAAFAGCGATEGSAVSPPPDAGPGADGGPPSAEGGDAARAPVTCTWTTNASTAPVVLDEVLGCSDNQIAAPGLRVAPAPDATWLATSSDGDHIVYRLAGAAEERQALPDSFTRTTMSLALGPDGNVHLAADTTVGPSYDGGATYLGHANGTWTPETVFDNPKKYTPLIDLEVGGDGAPLTWVVTDAPSEYTLAKRASNGTWATSAASLPVPARDAGHPRFTIASDGSIVALALAIGETSSPLRALVGGAVRTIGGPAVDRYRPVPDYAVTPAPAPTAAVGPLFAVAIAHDDGVHVIGEAASGPEAEVTVPGTTEQTPSCKTPEIASCTGTCHEVSDGMERRAFAIARTADGIVWLAYVVTHFDQTIAYSRQGDSGELCVGNVDTDRSTGTLHLVRVEGTTAKEVLTLPIDRPGTLDAFGSSAQWDDPRFVDMRGFGKDLAIGVRTGYLTNAVRVLRLDTSTL